MELIIIWSSTSNTGGRLGSSVPKQIALQIMGGPSQRPEEGQEPVAPLPDEGPILPRPDEPDDPARARRLDWATLMKRAYLLDVLVCPKCSGKMSIIAIIDDEEVAVRIRDHLGIDSRAPPRGRPRRRTGQQQLAFDRASDEFDGVDPPSTID